MRLARTTSLILAALVLAHCARSPARQVAQAPQVRSDLDAMVYGDPAPQRPVAARTAQYVPVRRAMPAESVAYTLDSGDKLRIVVFGQDTLSNTYAVDAHGMVVDAADRPGQRTRADHRATLAARSPSRLKQSLHSRPERRGGDRDPSAVLHSRRGHVPGAVSLRRQHDGGDRSRDRRRLHAARHEGSGDADAQDRGRARAALRCR